MNRFILPVALALPACGDPLEPRELIERPRVLGARVEVAGDPERAWPMPGETASVRVLVVEPAAPRPHRWMLAACSMAPVRTGPPTCSGPVLARAAGDDTTPPTLTFAAPDDGARATDVIAVRGAVCTESELVLSREGLPIDCLPSGDDATAFSAEVPLWTSDRTNENPTIQNAPWHVGNQTLEAPAIGVSAGDPCSGAAGMAVLSGADGAARISIGLGEDMREPLEPDDTVTGQPRETLLFSHFTTLGALDRAATFVEANDVPYPESLSITWEPPDAAPSEGTVVRLVVVVRDGRGGTDWALRDLCLVP